MASNSTTMPMHCDDEIRYDAFLAHSSKDRATVERVMHGLEERGVKCCYSKRDSSPGQDLIIFMQDAISKSWVTIAFFSSDFLQSPYCQAERQMALRKAVEVGRQVLIPLLLDVQVDDLPLAVRSLTCLSLDSEDWLIRLLKAMGVKDLNTRPTYHELKKKVQELDKEKCKQIQESLEYNMQNSAKMREKDDTIKQLKTQNAALVAKSEQTKKMALELDECKRQMSEMEEKLQMKDEIISKLQSENEALNQEATTVNQTSRMQPTVLDTYKKLRDMTWNEIKDMNKDEQMTFFTKLLLLLQTMTQFFPTDNAVLKRMSAAVLIWMGDNVWGNNVPKYHTQALELVQDLYGVNTAHCDTVWIQGCIGLNHFLFSDYHLAAEFYTQALQMQKQLVGPSGMSKEVANLYYWLGRSQTRMGSCSQEAIYNLTQSLEMYRNLPGNWDHIIKCCLSNLVLAYKQCGDRDMAAACQRELDSLYCKY